MRTPRRGVDKAWASESMAFLRLMAYNLVSLLRCRYLRRRDETRAERRRWEEFSDVLLLLISQVDRALFPLPPGNRRHLTPPAGRRSSLREGELFDKNTAASPQSGRAVAAPDGGMM